MLLSDSEKIKKCKQLHEQARFIRGRFLNFVAVIEHDLAQIITFYFCKDRDDLRELFFEQVASNMGLEKKKKLLVKIIENVFPEYFVENREIINSIQDIQQFRNKLAHSILDVSDEALSRDLEQGVGFVQWEGGAPISQDEFDKWEIKATQVGSMLTGVKWLIGVPTRPA